MKYFLFWRLFVNIVFVILEVEELVKIGGLVDVGKVFLLVFNVFGDDVIIVMFYY